MEQLSALVIDPVVNVPDVQQVVEHIVAGDDPAPLRDGGAVTEPIATQTDVVLKQLRAIEHRAAAKVQFFCDCVQDRGFPAAVSTAKDCDRLKLQHGHFQMPKEVEGVICCEQRTLQTKQIAILLILRGQLKTLQILHKRPPLSSWLTGCTALIGDTTVS